eukprot:1185210-Prorocentrum_minimum.AAC.3
MHVHDAAHHPQPLVAMHAAQLSVGWMTEERHGSGQLAASAVHPWQGGDIRRLRSNSPRRFERHPFKSTDGRTEL